MHEPVAHVSGGLVSQSDILRALSQDNLQVLGLGLDEVHEVVQVAGGGLGRVGEVSLLHRHQQRRQQQTVADDELASGDVNLDIKL